MSKVKVGCILLCAGKSTRMSPDHKLLMKIDDLSILKRTALEITSSQFYEVIAVTGFEAELVKPELKGLALEVFHNKNYESGMHSSIKEGLKHLNTQADYFAVCLADQPMLNHTDYNHLIETVNAHSDCKLFRPVFNGQFGNPSIISKDYISEIMNHEDTDKGCAYLFENHPESLMKVQMTSQSTLMDVDTHELFEEVKFHLKKRE